MTSEHSPDRPFHLAAHVLAEMLTDRKERKPRSPLSERHRRELGWWFDPDPTKIAPLSFLRHKPCIMFSSIALYDEVWDMRRARDGDSFYRGPLFDLGQWRRERERRAEQAVNDRRG